MSCRWMFSQNLSTLVLALCLALPAMWVAPECNAADTPRVLVLFSNDRLLPANQELEKGLRKAFLDETGNASVDLFGEFLDAVRFSESGFGAVMERFLKDRHHDKPPAVCITVGPQALDFLMQRRDALFPGVPVVFGGVTPADLGAISNHDGVAGRPMDWSITPLLEHLPSIRPEIRRILVIVGAADFDRKRHEEAMTQIQPFRPRYEIESSQGEDLDRVLQRVANLSDDTLVLYLSYFSTPTGKPMIPLDVATRVAKASRVPVVSVYDTYLGCGVLGGPMMPFEAEGLAIGEIARQVIASGNVASIGIQPAGKPVLVFDGRAMKRHGWHESRMPPGAVIRFKSPSLWEAHRTAVLVGSGALVFQSALIIGLFAARARQRLAEKERLQSESRFTGVFQGSPVSISIIRKCDGRIIDANPAWERTTHVTREQALGRTHLEMGFEFEGVSSNRFLEYLSSGKALRDFEQRLRMPDGSSRLLSVSTELLNLRGEPCYVSMAQDITDRQEAEEARQKLAQASRLGMLGEITASIAHEVNQPLGAILSNADAAMMLMETGDPPLDEIRAILADIRRDDLRASDVIRQVRSMVTRAETRMVPLDPGALATGVAGLVRHDCKRRGITITCETPDDLPKVCGEKVQLEQILLNLLLNAMDALTDSTTSEKRIHIAVEVPREGLVDISVRDSGPGITPEILPQIFGNFFTTKIDGMGLGLALSRSIAEAHGGRLVAENAADGGACLHLTLPTMP